MKKQYLYPPAVAAAMAVTALCRSWQRTTAFEEDTGLLRPGLPATWVLLGAIALFAAVFLAGAWWSQKDGQAQSYLAAFAMPPWALVFFILSGAVLLAAGVTGIREHGTNEQLSRYVLALVLLPTGLDMPLVGWLNTQRKEDAGRFAWPLLPPGICGCFWMISAYQEHTAQPNVMVYGVYFVGMVCAVCACYAISSWSFEKPRGMWTLWTGTMALVLLATKVADMGYDASPFEGLVSLGFMLYLAGQLLALQSSRCKPAVEPWVMPAQTDTDETTQDVEVTDHE